MFSWHEANPGQFKIPLPDAVYTVCATGSGRLLLGLSKRLCLVDAPALSGRRPEAIRWLASIDVVDQRTVISGGRADRDGRYVFGTRNTAPDGHKIGSFFQFSEQFGLRRLAIPTVVAASGICFNQAGTRLYFADESAAVLYQCSYDSASGGIQNLVPFARGDQAANLKDAFVDGDDCVWTVQSKPGAGGAVIQYAANGEMLQNIGIRQTRLSALSAYGIDLKQLILMGTNGALRIVGNLSLNGAPESMFDDAGIALESTVAFPVAQGA